MNLKMRMMISLFKYYVNIIWKMNENGSRTRWSCLAMLSEILIILNRINFSVFLLRSDWLTANVRRTPGFENLQKVHHRSWVLRRFWSGYKFSPVSRKTGGRTQGRSGQFNFKNQLLYLNVPMQVQESPACKLSCTHRPIKNQQRELKILPWTTENPETCDRS